MSEMSQLTRVPKRPRDAPGNDGYHLEVHPGFEDEQKCYHLAVTLPDTYDTASSTNVNINFPHIKLGAGMYVLDIERVVCSYQTSGALLDVIDAVNLNGTYTATVDGLGHTLTCSSTNACSTDMKYAFFFGGSSAFKRSATQSTITYYRNYDVMNQYTYSVPIENDTLNLSFALSDKDTYTYSNASSLAVVICSKVLHMVLRPNPSKSRYFEP